MGEALKLCGGAAVQTFQRELFQSDNILARIVRLERTAASHDADIASHDADIRDIKKQLAEMRISQREK